MNTLTAYAPEIDTENFGGALHIYDAAAKVKIGQVDMVRGFIHYTGVAGSAHAGVTAVIRTKNGDMFATLESELRLGIRSGRDDRR